MNLCINLVMPKWRLRSNHACQKTTLSRGGATTSSPFLSTEQPGKSRYLKELLNVHYTELGKPDGPRTGQLETTMVATPSPRRLATLHPEPGIPAARKGEGPAGRARRRKRTPPCNRGDRDLCPAPKGGPLPTGERRGERLGLENSRSCK